MYIHLRWIWDGLENRKITSAASCFLSGFRPARQSSFQEKLAPWGNRSPRFSVTEACSISKREAKTGHENKRRKNSDSSIVSAGLHFRTNPDPAGNCFQDSLPGANTEWQMATQEGNTLRTVWTQSSPCCLRETYPVSFNRTPGSECFDDPGVRRELLETLSGSPESEAFNAGDLRIGVEVAHPSCIRRLSVAGCYSSSGRELRANQVEVRSIFQDCPEFACVASRDFLTGYG